MKDRSSCWLYLGFVTDECGQPLLRLDLVVPQSKQSCLVDLTFVRFKMELYASKSVPQHILQLKRFDPVYFSCQLDCLAMISAFDNDRTMTGSMSSLG